MSVMYCDYCGVLVDTDYDVEHFDLDGECMLRKEHEELAKQEAMTYLEDA